MKINAKNNRKLTYEQIEKHSSKMGWVTVNIINMIDFKNDENCKNIKEATTRLMQKGIEIHGTGSDTLMKYWFTGIRSRTRRGRVQGRR